MAKDKSTGLKRRDTVLLFLGGFGFFLLGIGLVVGPKFSWRAQEYANALTHYTGIQGGVLLLAGLVFVALGIFSRRVAGLVALSPRSSSAEQPEDAPDVAFAVEQLAGDVAQLKKTVNLVLSDLGRSTQKLQELLQGQAELASTRPHDADAAPGPQAMERDPVFLLASSLDKMNARLDARLDALAERVDQRLAGLGATPVPAAVREEQAPALDIDEPDSFHVVQLEKESSPALTLDDPVDRIDGLVRATDEDEEPSNHPLELSDPRPDLDLDVS